MSRTESPARSLHNELIRLLSTMRSTIHDSNLRCEFDRSFQECFSTIDVSNYIRTQGRISLEHTSHTISSTFKTMSEYCAQQSTQLSSTPTNTHERWTYLSYTFWNEHLAAQFQDLNHRIEQLQSNPGSVVPNLSKLRISTGTPTPARRPTMPQDRPTHKQELIRLTPMLNTSVFIHPGKNACRVPNCQGCLKIFGQAPLVRCRSVHPKTAECTSTGWFPHLSSAQWSRFKHIHLRPDFKFQGRHPTAQEKYNPLRHVNTDGRATAEPVSQGTSQPPSDLELAPTSPALGTSTSPQYDPEGPPSGVPYLWADQVQLEEDARRKADPSDAFVIPYKRRRPAHLDTM